MRARGSEACHRGGARASVWAAWEYDSLSLGRHAWSQQQRRGVRDAEARALRYSWLRRIDPARRDNPAARRREAWHASPDRRDADAAIGAAFNVAGGADGAVAAIKRSDAPWATQFRVLFSRALNNVKRNPMAGKAKVGEAVIFGIIIAVIWFQVTNDQNGVQDRSGALFFFCANGMMQNIMGTLTTFSNERAAVLREQENGVYGTSAYFISRVLVDVPVKVFCPSLFATIAYWSVGFQPVLHKFLLTVITLVLLALAGERSCPYGRGERCGHDLLITRDE